MPKVALTVPETYESITRPVVNEVTQELLRILGMPENTPVQYPGPSGMALQNGTPLSPDASTPNFNANNLVVVSASEEDNAAAVLSTAVYQNENRAIFADSDLGVGIRPIYSSTEVTLSFRFRFQDQTSALRWRDDMRIRYGMGRVENLHEITYHYSLPPSYLVILTEIHAMRERVAGLGEDLKGWFSRCFTERKTGLTNQVGTAALLAITETQDAVLGWFDFTTAPPAPERGDNGTWTAGFDYRFTYDKVIALHMYYPLMIHNQVVGPKFRPEGPAYQLASHKRSPSFSRNNFDYFQNKYPGWKDPLDGVPVPIFDDWLPENVIPFTSSLLRFMLFVDEADPKAILNLLDIGDYYLEPKIIPYLKNNARWLHQPYEAALHVGLYQKTQYLGHGAAVVDRQLNVSARNDQSLRLPYHLRFSVVNDLTVLSERAKEALRKDGDAFGVIVDALYPGQTIPKLSNGTIPRRDFDKIIKDIADTNHPYKGSTEVRRMTVGSFLIVARKETDDAHRA